MAAKRVHQDVLQSLYVSVDALGTAHWLFELGVASDLVAGDSCARTT
jgi:hypothetical protein